MKTLRNLLHALRCAWAAGSDKYHRVRYQQARRDRVISPFGE